ncbi:sigma-70 family RNA polymerase sigma factor [Neobacillus sp. SM06]|uniref:sigma-70 family RNA polymerase sigma factor n=1 Tax=Neobacillus sp. SM06 TaxID=3422492 RepID=UPI003D28F3F3
MNNRMQKVSEQEESVKIIEWYPRLQQYSRFLAQNKWDGEDIAQEAVIKACVHYSTLSTALLHKIAYHHWIDVIRQRARETLVEEIPEGAMLEKKAATDVQMELVESFLKKLTPKQAVIFALKEGFQYQTAEIAEILNTTEMAVKAALLRSKKQLAKMRCSDIQFPTKWEETEESLLTSLFYQSFFYQDPTVLIEAVPTIRSLAREVQPATWMRHSSSPVLLAA